MMFPNCQVGRPDGKLSEFFQGFWLGIRLGPTPLSIRSTDPKPLTSRG